MKRMKKLISLLVTLAMILAMSVTAFAEETFSITINNSATGHTYEAYQIFSGTISDNKLTNIQWGNGINDEGKAALGDAAAKAETLKNEADAKAFAKNVAGYLGTVAGSANTVSDGKYVISGLSAGYYLVKDQNNSLTGADDAYTSYIVKVVDNTPVDPKSAKPTVDKQVWDENADAESGASDGWGESADHAINETFQFKLIANLPVDTDFAAYEKYKVVFTDTMSAGVTFESIASVTVDGVGVSEDQYNCTATTGQAGGSWTLTINDIKAISGVDLTNGADVVVIYNAHLNENAQVNHDTGNTTNKNTVSLQYSNNPTVTGEHAGEELGQTAEDHVWVFTYEVDNTKVDATDSENKTPLAGAGFKLYDSTGTTEIGLIYDASLSAYRPVKSGETAVEMTSAETTGEFKIKGLDAGTYVLKETTVPSGYNKCADTTIVINATHVEAADGASATTTLNSDSNMTNTIENKQGSTLPSTGGIGTTIFYVIGTILVLGAGVLLVAKRRMNRQ